MPSPLPLPARTARPQPVSPRIDDPIALLRACHEKVVRFTQLAQRLQAHVAEHGADAQAREAATAVLRYFTLAAPLHHADEDENLFVALRALGHADVNARIDALQQEHDTLGALWLPVRAWLAHIAEGQTPPHGSPDGSPDVDGFATRYRAHVAQEEASVYPHAAELPAPVLRALADAMVARRSPPQD
ncbi:hemerythrin HHE cation binding domain-containing protein [Aquabacterium commune]|uniref:Hemerythrin HHE cation binding domain-containing protein n=1 Tax=Aquabacterium commune TaxID=70586 RepID=A0A4R6RCB1_9BURK|nr:hemerythrin domain-containing protein [Aquabacterium commune]TDP83704.1 hemerythrin HHE cation binding domain-containing protein [Aquabacterium commune]